jgi:hypothetical protein
MHEPRHPTPHRNGVNAVGGRGNVDAYRRLTTL